VAVEKQTPNAREGGASSCERETPPAGMAAAAVEPASSSRGLLGSSRDFSNELGGMKKDGGAEDQPFRFEARRARLDWRLLHAVDVDRVMRENDIDALESTLARGGSFECVAHAHSHGRNVSFFFLPFNDYFVSLREKTPHPLAPTHAPLLLRAFVRIRGRHRATPPPRRYSNDQNNLTTSITRRKK
jgi:hypothetical protein